MGKKIQKSESKELMLSPEIIHGEMVIIFPKSQVFSYVYAVAIAKNADVYAEGIIGNRLHHVACFESIDNKINIIFSIIQMLHHTKGIQVFVRGELLNPLTVFDVISCFKSAKKSLNKTVYCTILINSQGLPCSVTSTGEAVGTLPCRILAGRAYQRLRSSLGNRTEIIDSLAVQEGVYWCPYFFNTEEITIPIELTNHIDPTPE